MALGQDRPGLLAVGRHRDLAHRLAVEHQGDLLFRSLPGRVGSALQPQRNVARRDDEERELRSRSVAPDERPAAVGLVLRPSLQQQRPRLDRAQVNHAGLSMQLGQIHDGDQVVGLTVHGRLRGSAAGQEAEQNEGEASQGGDQEVVWHRKVRIQRRPDDEFCLFTG